jgi:hypothetical protein
VLIVAEYPLSALGGLGTEPAGTAIFNRMRLLRLFSPVMHPHVGRRDILAGDLLARVFAPPTATPVPAPAQAPATVAVGGADADIETLLDDMLRRGDPDTAAAGDDAEDTARIEQHARRRVAMQRAWVRRCVGISGRPRSGGSLATVQNTVALAVLGSRIATAAVEALAAAAAAENLEPDLRLYAACALLRLLSRHAARAPDLVSAHTVAAVLHGLVALTTLHAASVTKSALAIALGAAAQIVVPWAVAVGLAAREARQVRPRPVEVGGKGIPSPVPAPALEDDQALGLGRTLLPLLAVAQAAVRAVETVPGGAATHLLWRCVLQPFLRCERAHRHVRGRLTAHTGAAGSRFCGAHFDSPVTTSIVRLRVFAAALPPPAACS